MQTTVFSKLNSIINELKTHVSLFNSERATKIDNIDNKTSNIINNLTDVKNNTNKIDISISSRAPSSTALSNVVWTDDKAESIDTIKNNTASSSSNSKTGTLSQKLGYVISLLENSTYGLSALKNAIFNNSNKPLNIVTVNNITDKSYMIFNSFPLNISTIRPRLSGNNREYTAYCTNNGKMYTWKNNNIYRYDITYDYYEPFDDYRIVLSNKTTIYGSEYNVANVCSDSEHEYMYIIDINFNIYKLQNNNNMNLTKIATVSDMNTSTYFGKYNMCTDGTYIYLLTDTTKIKKINISNGDISEININTKYSSIYYLKTNKMFVCEITGNGFSNEYYFLNEDFTVIDTAKNKDSNYPLYVYNDILIVGASIMIPIKSFNPNSINNYMITLIDLTNNEGSYGFSGFIYNDVYITIWGRSAIVKKLKPCGTKIYLTKSSNIYTDGYLVDLSKGKLLFSHDNKALVCEKSIYNINNHSYLTIE